MTLTSPNCPVAGTMPQNVGNTIANIQGLKKYYNNGKIGAITGNNFLKKKIKIKNKYFYSKYANCWGWATWRSRWKLYEKKISFWPKFKKTKKWENFFASKEEKTYWEFYRVTLIQQKHWKLFE